MPQRLYALLPVATVSIALVAFFALGSLRAQPENILLPHNVAHQGGHTQGSVKRAYDFARDLAEAPLSEIHEHLVYKGHNPGLFQLATVVLMKAGVEDLHSLQLLPLLLSTASIGLFFALVSAVFRHRWIGAWAAVYIAFCPPFLTYASALHAAPYGRFFELTALLCFLHFLRGRGRWLLPVTGLFWFLACWNYWQWSVETGILLVGLHYVERGTCRSSELARLLVAPLAAWSSILIVLSVRMGGIGEAWSWLLSVATHRSLDLRQAGGYLPGNPVRDLLGAREWGGYLEAVGSRIETWYYLGPAVLALMIAWVLAIHARERETGYRFFLFLIPAAFYWHVLMVQHVSIHFFTAALHYPLIAITVGCFLVETPRWVSERLAGRPFRRTVAALVLVPVLYPVLTGVVKDLSYQLWAYERVAVVSDFEARAAREAAAATPEDKMKLRWELEGLDANYELSDSKRAALERLIERHDR